MKDGADTGHRRQAERAGEAEGVEEGEDAEDGIALVKMENLFDLLDVGGEVEVGEKDAFGFAGGAAGKNDGGGVVERRLASEAEGALEQAGGEKLGGKQGGEFFGEPGIFRQIFDIDYF